MRGHRRRLARAALAAVTAVALGAAAGCSSDGDDASAFCAAVAAAPSLDSVIQGFAEQEPVTLDRNLDDAQAAFAAVRDTAPGEIEEDATELVAVVDLVIEAVRDNPDDRAAAVEAIERGLAGRDGADDAAIAVAAYAKDACDVDLNAGLTDVTTTTVVNPPTTASG